MIHKTFAEQPVDQNYSNQVWQYDSSMLDILLIDPHGELVGRPYLTMITDSYSRCIMGFHLGFDTPSFQSVALALRHAILPKQYEAEYKLDCEWGTYGVPEILVCDASRDSRSQRLEKICLQLGINCRLRNNHFSQGGFTERIFQIINTEFLAVLPGYIGSHIQAQECLNTPEEGASLTLQELNLLLVHYIVDVYNQKIDSRTRNQTRLQRWESGLSDSPVLLNQQDLDICLMN